MGNGWISQQREKPRTLVVHPASPFLDDLHNRPSLDRTPGNESFRLRVQVFLVLAVGNAGVDRYFSGDMALVRWVIDNHRPTGQLIPSDLASLPHPPRRTLPSSYLLLRYKHFTK